MTIGAWLPVGLRLLAGGLLAACRLLARRREKRRAVRRSTRTASARGFDAGGTAIVLPQQRLRRTRQRRAVLDERGVRDAQRRTARDLPQERRSSARRSSRPTASRRLRRRYEDDDAIVLGSILSLKGTNASSGQAELNSAALALDDFPNTVVGLPGRRRRQAAPARPRRVRRLGRRRRRPQRSATHLVSDVGVPAILGPDSSGLVTGVINNGDHPDQGAAHQPRGDERDALGHVAVLLAHVAVGQHPGGAPRGLSVGEIATAPRPQRRSSSPSSTRTTPTAAGSSRRSPSTLQINGVAVGDPLNAANFKPVQYPRQRGGPRERGRADLLGFRPEHRRALRHERGRVADPVAARDGVADGGHPAAAAVLPRSPTAARCRSCSTRARATIRLRTRIRGTVPGTNNALFQAFSLQLPGQVRLARRRLRHGRQLRLDLPARVRHRLPRRRTPSTARPSSNGMSEHRRRR